MWIRFSSRRQEGSFFRVKAHSQLEDIFSYGSCGKFLLVVSENQVAFAPAPSMDQFVVCNITTEETTDYATVYQTEDPVVILYGSDLANFINLLIQLKPRLCDIRNVCEFNTATLRSSNKLFSGAET